MLKKTLFMFFLFPFFAWGQQKELGGHSLDYIHIDATASAIGTSNGRVPFWIRTNNNGSIPLDGISGSFIGTIRKDFKCNDSINCFARKPDWAAGVNLRLNTGNKIDGILVEAYLKARYNIFQFALGRTKDIMGLVDSTLSSGAFSQSGNALGIPKIDLSIPEYWDIPLTKRTIAIKGNFAFGYIGKTDIYQKQFTNTSEAMTYFHQKSLYGRIGKPEWRLNFYGGFNHQVFFGNESKILGPYFQLSGPDYLWYIVSGKPYGNQTVASSKIGNHIGSIDQGLTYNFKKVQLFIYHQFFYDIGGLYHFTNIKDGLWGVSISNKNEQNNIFRWNKLVVEFLNTTSQGGELNAKPTPSGDENYYNNYVYEKGWSYKNENIGNNFITSQIYQRKELPSYKYEWIGNNRVLLLHFGGDFNIQKWRLITKLSFSRNFGTYAISPIGSVIGTKRTVLPPPYFTPVNQSSGYIEVSRPVRNNLYIGFVLAVDYGDLLYNSIGGIIKLTKTF